MHCNEITEWKKERIRREHWWLVLGDTREALKSTAMRSLHEWEWLSVLIGLTLHISGRQLQSSPQSHHYPSMSEWAYHLLQTESMRLSFPFSYTPNCELPCSHVTWTTKPINWLGCNRSCSSNVKSIIMNAFLHQILTILKSILTVSSHLHKVNLPNPKWVNNKAIGNSGKVFGDAKQTLAKPRQLTNIIFLLRKRGINSSCLWWTSQINH